MLKIYLNTWGNYNKNGANGGQWITLPMDSDELEETLETIATQMPDPDPEFFINDYEWTDTFAPFQPEEMDNIHELNEQLQELDSLQEYEQKEVAAAMEAFSYSLTEAIERQQQGYFEFYPGQTIEDVAYDLIEECYITKDTPEIFKLYFDYEAFARDLGIDGYTETKYGVIYCCC